MTNNPSKYITEFLNFLSQAQSHYSFCLDELSKQDKLTQDYLHSLELDELKCRERSKIATQLSINRKDRRYYKDRIEELQSLMEWLDKPENKKAIRSLEQALGAVRRMENYHKNRFYVPKVLKKSGERNDK